MSSPFSILNFRLTSHLSYDHDPIRQLQPPVDGKAIFYFPAVEDKDSGAYSCEYNLDVSPEVFSKEKYFYISVEGTESFLSAA